MITKQGAYLRFRKRANDTAKHLEQHGWAVARGVFSSAEVKTLRKEISAVYDELPGDQRGPNPEAWDMFRYEMLNRSPACQKAIGHRGILKVIEPLLGEDCHIIANTAWRNPPTSARLHGGQHWHIDAGPHVPLDEGMVWPEDIPHPVFAVGTHIFLKECGLKDGPTGVIPGSHLSGKPPPQDRLLDDDLTWQGVGVKPLLAKPGDVAFFVSDVWHRRMPTKPGDRGRFFLQAHYGRRDIAQRLKPTSERNQLSEAAVSRARSKRAKTVAGLHPRFFYDG